MKTLLAAASFGLCLKILLIGLGLLIALEGCATARIKASMDPYVGRPLADIAERIGPPDTSFEGSGGRIFQWNHHGGKRTTGSAVVVGGVLLANRNTQTVDCMLSITARPARPNPTPALVDWITVKMGGDRPGVLNGQGC